MAQEVTFRRLFLDKFSEALLESIRNSEGSTLPAYPNPRTLASVGEVNEPDSSSNSSRSSSRSSRRSRSATSSSRAQHDRSRRRGWAPGTGDVPTAEQGGPPPNGLRSRSSTSSLRLDPDGVPLEDGAEDDSSQVSLKKENSTSARFYGVTMLKSFICIAPFCTAGEPCCLIPTRTPKGHRRYTAFKAPRYIRWYIAINHSSLLRRRSAVKFRV